MGKVFLVGAGPGNPKLITVRGMELLKLCDAVVYDRLASNELLDYVKPDCVKIYVGKQAGHHSKNQEEINEILVDCAKQYDHIVRLKGGDPFVFGRGGEEIEVLHQYEIEYEVVPGITSAIAVPECAGIPVTHRGVSRSFHVITGHTKKEDGLPDCDYSTLSKLNGTLVFLMGLGNLKTIASELIHHGKSPETPTAVISAGTTNHQIVIRSTLKSIVKEADKRKVPSPAVIVIGETAAFDYRSFNKLLPKKIGITATRALREKLETKLEALGAVTYSLCDMEIVLTDAFKLLDQELMELPQYHWILFTSQNGVTLFFERLKKQKVDIRNLSFMKFAVLGSGTAKALEEYGIHADFIPSKYTVTVLAKELSKVIDKNEKVLIARAAKGSMELIEILKENGISFYDIPIYDVVGRTTDQIESVNQMDCLIFVSSSGVRAFFDELNKKKIQLSNHVKIACIGEVTSETVREQQIEADIIASTYNTVGLVEAIKKYFDQSGEEV